MNMNAPFKDTLSNQGRLIFLAKQYICAMKLILNVKGNDKQSDVGKCLE